MKDLMLILHFIGLTMGLGTGFANAFLGKVASKMSAAEATKFRLHSLVLSKMGYIGITLLVISGLYMITPYWKVLSTMPLLIVKLILAAVLILLISLIGIAGKKANNGDAEVQLKKMETLGKLALLTGIAIIVLAANIFH
ncbi:hypothetical protein [Flavihumibacter fluvii]|uniref:hypothetical protein n=1 Tax=Flavihumibacter fluvii TaxID=2838157 RepID=UPI001BDE2F6D|nr:hypothetical protein [Flavihumibacter fluvii]ULQ51334.1 hypothetical protein KJS93_14685 [Flavihumibacter fluvii]